MLKPIYNAAAAASAWLARRPGYMLLTAPDERLAGELPQRFARAWIGVMVTSVLWGGVLANLWGVTWKVFRDYDPLVLPAMATAGLFCLWPYRRGVAALAELLSRRDAAVRSVTTAVVVLVVALSLLGLKPDWHRWEFDLPGWLVWLLRQVGLNDPDRIERSLRWLRPQAKLYRVLLLMPPWGGWAMLIGVKFSRPTDRTEPQVAAFARGCGALAAAACMALLMLVSVAWFHHLGTGSQVAILVVTVLAAVLGGAALCRAAGGPTRKALLASNVTTQIAFVLAYLAGR
jgi:hypothetical protein